MILKSLDHLQDLDKAGLLARAAFSFDDTRYPLSAPVFPNELKIRQQIFSEIKENLGIKVDDDSVLSNSRIEDVLDQQLSSILAPRDEGEVLKGMVQSGELPADLYKINFASDTSKGNVLLNRKDHLRIIETVKHADREEHVPGIPSVNGEESKFISIFSKFFPSSNPFNSFVGVVIALRANDFALNVVQFIRIYEEKIYSGSGGLIDVLRRFSDSYGASFLYNGKKTKFVWGAETGVRNRTVDVLPDIAKDSKGRRKEIVPEAHAFIAHTANLDESKVLVFFINLKKYIASLKLHSWDKDLPLYR